MLYFNFSKFKFLNIYYIYTLYNLILYIEHPWPE